MNSSNTPTVVTWLQWMPSANLLVPWSTVYWAGSLPVRRIGDPRDAPGWPFVHIA
jgi:hypothetical protein